MSDWRAPHEKTLRRILDPMLQMENEDDAAIVIRAALAEIDRLAAELELARLQIEVANLVSKPPGTYRE
jgi:hypothetical protein